MKNKSFVHTTRQSANYARAPQVNSDLLYNHLLYNFSQFPLNPLIVQPMIFFINISNIIKILKTIYPTTHYRLSNRIFGLRETSER